VVVVEKPPGMTTHRHADEAAEFGARARRFLPPTLADLLPPLLPGNGPVRAVHRIDRDTSGLVVFARTPEAEAHLGKQFRAHRVARRYLAITRGTPPEGRIESWLVRDRGDGRRGSGSPEKGQRAVTHVRVLEELGSCALVECRLETGRTHQVRIHLGEAGAPLAGERVYDRPLHGAPVPDPSGAPRVALHAARIGFVHPTTGEWREWESPLPDDLEAVRRRLRPG
jgi:23S rRNA pseudouridine1911/1915/1917 synthase